MRHLLKDEWVISVSTTLFFHLLLLIFFLVFKVSFNPLIAEFVEVSFSGGFEAAAAEASRGKKNIAKPPEALKEEQAIPAANAKSIDLPERRMLDLNEEEIIESIPRDMEKIVEGPPAMKQNPVTALPSKKSDQPFNPFLKKEKRTDAGLFTKSHSDSLLAGKQKMEIAPGEEFEIDWLGDIKREISQKKLPDFPPDVQREATIKIQFMVLPNGLIGSAVLLQKGDTKLENTTLKSFKSWRFNPLPDYVEQKTQTGIITFRFKLE